MIEQINQKATVDSSISIANNVVCNMYATIESDGRFNVNFNATAAKEFFDNEAEALKDLQTLLAEAIKVARDRHNVLDVPVDSGSVKKGTTK